MITPSDSPSAPALYASVAPAGQGTAPYDVQADNGEAQIAAALGAATSVAGAGVLYPAGPRQMQAGGLQNSPAGYGAQDVTAGFSGGGGESWPGNPSP